MSPGDSGGAPHIGDVEARILLLERAHEDMRDILGRIEKVLTVLHEDHISRLAVEAASLKSRHMLLFLVGVGVPIAGVVGWLIAHVKT